MMRMAVRLQRGLPRLSMMLSGITLLCLLGACVSATEFDNCKYHCEQTRPDDLSCGVTFSLDSDCAAFVTYAELEANHCLDPQVLRPGSSINLCYFPADGEEVTWMVRSDEWVWGPYKDACVEPGEFSMYYHLSCTK